MKVTRAFFIASFCCLAAACTRQAPVDPSVLGQEASLRAQTFYELVTKRRLPEAAVYFSKALREKYPDPMQEPLLKQRASEQFVQALPRLDRVDWRKKIVYFRVSLHMPVTVADKVVMEPRGVSLDHWVFEDDVWLYGGRSLE